jgi:hypothetical protein
MTAHKPTASDAPSEGSERDADELSKFATYLRLMHEAEKAGATRDEAARSIYPDLYEVELARSVRRTEGA